ncbi:hypothetical protein [Acaryochloris sp. IP29b_bin.137]|uniref:hypothetical protein n=1 Tax=Acaryochloris sp. IP29b_bin.137 TaxID=2969217 RepID=UPI00261CD57A|nr:hypothetical protein [Acaryochloris sp. IP29b_bin.137]
MLITKHTNQVLKVQVKGWRNRYLDVLITRAIPIFGVLIILMGNIFSPKVHLSCNRATVDSFFTERTQIICSHVESNILTASNVLKEKITQIKYLQSAKLGYCRSCENGGSFRVVLIANHTKIPLTPDYIYSKSVVARQVAEIKAFINNPGEATLDIYEEHRWLYYLVGFAITTLGIWSVFSKKLTSFTFDKSSGKLYLDYHNSLFQLDVREERLDDIKKFDVEKTINDEGKKNYSVNILLNTGELISLGLVANECAITKTIHQFLSIDDSIDD